MERVGHGKIRAALQASEKPLLGAIADVMAEERKANVAALEELRREGETLRAELDKLAERVNGLYPGERSAVPPHLRAVD